MQDQQVGGQYGGGLLSLEGIECCRNPSKRREYVSCRRRGRCM